MSLPRQKLKFEETTYKVTPAIGIVMIFTHNSAMEFMHCAENLPV